MPVYSAMKWNCFEPSINGNKVTHKQYYNEAIIEPYRYNNYENKPVKQWYNETMQAQRKRINADYKTYYNMNSFQNYYYFK